MNICLLTPTFLPKIGGVEITVSSLAAKLRLMDHQPSVVTQYPRRGKGTPDDTSLPYNVYRYRRPWSFVFAPGMRCIHSALTTAHKRHKFDLIHCHLVYPAGFIAVKFAKRHRLPVIITPHGSDIRPDSRYRSRQTVWNRILLALRNAQLTTAISPTMRDALMEILDDQTAIEQIPNGVDIDQITAPTAHQPDWPIGRDTEYVLYIGGLTQKKGVDILLNAMKIVEAHQPGLVNLVIAGQGPLIDKLQRYTAENNISHAVTFVGLVTGPFKRYLFQHCRYVVMPSRTEAMPLVALEALACGKPILAADVEGLRQIVTDTVTGRLVPPQDPQALAQAMIQLHSSDTTAMRAAAVRYARQYDWRTITAQYITAYSRLLTPST